MCLIVFRVGRRVFGTCKLLQLGSTIQDYDWTLHPSSLFHPIFVMKKFRIFTSVLNGIRTLGLTSYYTIWHYTQVVFFISFITKGRRVWIFGGRQVFGVASYYRLGLILRTMIGHYIQLVFFCHYYWKLSNYLD